MSRRTWYVDEKPWFDDTAVFSVWNIKNGEQADVRVADDATPRCVRCSGPMSEMLTSCPHAQAVKRYLKAQGG